MEKKIEKPRDIIGDVLKNPPDEKVIRAIIDGLVDPVLMKKVNEFEKEAQRRRIVYLNTYVGMVNVDADKVGVGQPRYLN